MKRTLEPSHMHRWQHDARVVLCRACVIDAHHLEYEQEVFCPCWKMRLPKRKEK